MSEIPRQYVKVLTKPAASRFAEEMGKASWAMVWLQLLILIIINFVFTSLANLFPVLQPALQQSQLPFLSSPLATILSTPIIFFIEMGLIYLFARAFRGKGTFLVQSYTALLVLVPLGLLSSILSAILGLIPGAGLFLIALVGIIIAIYETVLLIYASMAVHRLSGGKATAAVLLPFLIIILLVSVGGAIFGILIATHSR
jgi:hypothetical protein